MRRDESAATWGETTGALPQQDEAVTRLSNSKMLGRLREMSSLAGMQGPLFSEAMDEILKELTEVKRQHRTFFQEVKRARATHTKTLARKARLRDRRPFPHPRPWNDSPLLDPERERMTPEAIAGDALLEWQEIKRARNEASAEHPSWKYPNVDRAFGEPPLYSCTDSFKRVLEAHLEQAVAKITANYEGMGEGTLRLSNLKAEVGAELWLMQSSLDEVRKRLEKSRSEAKRKELRESYRGDVLEET